MIGVRNITVSHFHKSTATPSINNDDPLTTKHFQVFKTIQFSEYLHFLLAPTVLWAHSLPYIIIIFLTKQDHKQSQH